MSKFNKVFKDPRSILRRILVTANFAWLSDKPYLELMYYAHFGKKLNLKNPTTFNEKLQWLKLYDRKPEYIKMVDKYEAKKYVAEQIGEEHIIPTLGVWDSVEDIDFDILPNQFVLKCTHDCGGLVICKDKTLLDIDQTKAKLRNSLKKKYYYWGREWPYKNVKPRIIAETFMGDNLLDYKLFCFGGKPEMTLVCSDRYTASGLCEDFFDNSWTHLDLKRPGHNNAKYRIQKPLLFEQMKQFAESLSKSIPFSRIDFYEIHGQIYFGEITFFPASGMAAFDPVEWDNRLGGKIILPDNNLK